MAAVSERVMWGLGASIGIVALAACAYYAAHLPHRAERGGDPPSLKAQIAADTRDLSLVGEEIGRLKYEKEHPLFVPADNVIRRQVRLMLQDDVNRYTAAIRDKSAEITHLEAPLHDPHRHDAAVLSAEIRRLQDEESKLEQALQDADMSGENGDRSRWEEKHAEIQEAAHQREERRKEIAAQLAELTTQKNQADSEEAARLSDQIAALNQEMAELDDAEKQDEELDTELKASLDATAAGKLQIETLTRQSNLLKARIEHAEAAYARARDEPEPELPDPFALRGLRTEIQVTEDLRDRTLRKLRRLRQLSRGRVRLSDPEAKLNADLRLAQRRKAELEADRARLEKQGAGRR